MKNGAYYAHVTDDRMSTVFVDEEAVRDAQMHQIFANRDKVLEDRRRKADRQSHKEARKFRTMARECLWLTGTAALVYCTCIWGVYAAIAAVTGCMVAAGCRVIHYITTKER